MAQDRKQQPEKKPEEKVEWMASSMTMRDKFAETAISGIALHSVDRVHAIAERAYALADAMMEARKPRDKS